ncbi:MAG: phosphate signaling complex protein PhoU [Janthinobacterium lividum]
MPRINFQQQLAALKDKLLAMASLSQQALELAVEAYLQRDMGLCHHVDDIEAAINAADRDVDEMAYELLAKEQPMAIDLRFLLAVIKINGDLERVGDQAAAIVKRCRELQAAVGDIGPETLPGDIAGMGEVAVKMIQLAIRSLLDGDADLAERVLEMDDEIDRMNHEAQNALREEMTRRPESTENALNSIIVARNLERSADHATNIAEDVIFWVRGADVRHTFTQAANHQPQTAAE